MRCSRLHQFYLYVKFTLGKLIGISHAVCVYTMVVTSYYD